MSRSMVLVRALLDLNHLVYTRDTCQAVSVTSELAHYVMIRLMQDTKMPLLLDIPQTISLVILTPTDIPKRYQDTEMDQYPMLSALNLLETSYLM